MRLRWYYEAPGEPPLFWDIDEWRAYRRGAPVVLSNDTHNTHNIYQYTFLYNTATDEYWDWLPEH